MTTWVELKKYIHDNYKVEEVNEGFLKLLFDTESGRSQLVFIEHAFNDNADWVKVTSPFGKLEKIDLAAAARMLAERIVGGLIVVNELVVIANSLPLENLDANEINETMLRITFIADELEKLFVGKDDW